jgi:PPM family protein phosphatase
MTVLGETEGSAELSTGRGVAVRVAWAAVTDVGLHRSVNEDSLVAVPPVFAVADGMGGHAAGDLASARAVERLAEHATSDAAAGGWGGEQLVQDALGAAADDIDQLSEEVGSAGTTVTGAVLTDGDDGPEFLVFNLGDSRVYSLRGNELRRETRDHSVVQEMVDAGMISEDQAESHPESNVITRALGFREDPHPDLTRVRAVPGTRLLVCSDGLTKEVDSAHLRLLLAAGLAPSVTAGALVDAALAAGGHDNVTVLVVDVLG